MFDALIGNSYAKRVLKRLVANRLVGNSLLFSGPRGVGKGQFARAFANALVEGSQADLRVYRPAGRAALHAIDTIREMSQEIHLLPTQSRCKVFIIDEAERLPKVSANALLKTFEEPPLNTLILLVSSAPDRLLPTIRSRCRQLSFKPVKTNEIAQYLQQHHGQETQTAQRFARQARGSVSAALRLVKQGGDVIQERLLHLLASAPLSDYYHLSHYAREIANALEALRNEALTDARRAAKADLADLSASAREQLEKELEGAAARVYFDEIDRLLETVALWYRDTLLFSHCQDTRLLMFPEHAADFGVPIPLDKVQKSLTHCRSAVSRFSKLVYAIEALFLALNIIEG